MKNSRRKSKSGSALIAVLTLGLAASVLVVGMVSRNEHSDREAHRGLARLEARMYAESATEELFLLLQQTLRDPGSEIRRSLLTAVPGGPEIPLIGFRPDNLQDELGKSTGGGRITFELVEPTLGQGFGSLRFLSPLSADRGERSGVVGIEATIRATVEGRSFQERVVREHSFRFVRASLTSIDPPSGNGRPFSLYVVHPDPRMFPAVRLPPGVPFPALWLPGKTDDPRLEVGYRDLRHALTPRHPDRIKAAPRVEERRMTEHLERFSPVQLAGKAHFVTESTDQLLRFLGERVRAGSTVRMDGVIHCRSSDRLRLDLSGGKFRGQCVISHEGPIEIGEIALDDQSRDSLLLVSPRVIVVTGRRVEASLMCHGPGALGVRFARKTRVMGPIVSETFPEGLGITRQELRDCEIGTGPLLTSPDEEFRDFVGLLSPHPILLDHGRGN